jgi:hypothetical protein
LSAFADDVPARLHPFKSPVAFWSASQIRSRYSRPLAVVSKEKGEYRENPDNDLIFEGFHEPSHEARFSPEASSRKSDVI